MKTQEEQLAFAHENKRLTNLLVELHQRLIASRENGESEEEQQNILKESLKTQEMMKKLVNDYMAQD